MPPPPLTLPSTQIAPELTIEIALLELLLSAATIPAVPAPLPAPDEPI